MCWTGRDYVIRRAELRIPPEIIYLYFLSQIFSFCWNWWVTLLITFVWNISGLPKGHSSRITEILLLILMSFYRTYHLLTIPQCFTYVNVNFLNMFIIFLMIHAVLICMHNDSNFQNVPFCHRNKIDDHPIGWTSILTKIFNLCSSKYYSDDNLWMADKNV